jgi:MFS family permease
MTSLKNKFKVERTFAALKHRNYNLWFTGQIISLLGSWMQITAQGFFIFELTHSPIFLGYIGFANGIPTWLFMVYAGVFADRFQRRNILIVTQSIMMLLAFILAFLTFAHLIQPWHIILLAFLLGIANAFEAPARQAFVNELVSREDLFNAIALNSTMFHSGAAIGPAIAGLTYAVFGPAWCFIINGISFIAVIYNLVRMRFENNFIKPANKSTLNELIGGFKYLKQQKTIMLLMITVAMTSMFGIGVMTLIPAWAVKILHGNASTNGFLQASRGLGAVVCSLIIASQSNKIERKKVLSWGLVILAFSIFLFSFNRTFLLSCILLFGVGIGTIVVNNLANGLTQTLITEEYRGRIMGIYSFCFFAVMPLGALLIGILAEHFGSPTAVLVYSLILIIYTIIMWTALPRLKEKTKSQSV